MKYKMVWIRAMIFTLSAGAFYYVSRVIVFVSTWISNIFKPIPEGVDMYRDANLALETMPNMSSGVGISVIIALCGAVLLTLFWKPYLKHTTNHITENTPIVHEDYEADIEYQSVKEEQKVPIVSHDWYDHSLEDHDSEDGWCTECEEFEEDLD